MPDPIKLGRSVVVGPGGGAPPEWSSCDRIRVEAIDSSVADELGSAWRDRRSLIVELTPGLGFDDPVTPPPETVVGRQPWEWPVTLDLVGERLHHGIWANSADARLSVADPRTRWVDAAIRLGATGETSGADADVVLPDGTPAVCDGGPLRHGYAGPGWFSHRPLDRHRAWLSETARE